MAPSVRENTRANKLRGVTAQGCSAGAAGLRTWSRPGVPSYTEDRLPLTT